MISEGDQRVSAGQDPLCLHGRGGTSREGVADRAGGAVAPDSAAAVGIVLRLVASNALHRPSPAGDRAILTLVRCALDGDAAADVVLRHALGRRPTRHRRKRRAARRDGGSQ